MLLKDADRAYDFHREVDDANRIISGEILGHTHPPQSSLTRKVLAVHPCLSRLQSIGTCGREQSFSLGHSELNPREIFDRPRQRQGLMPVGKLLGKVERGYRNTSINCG